MLLQKNEGCHLWGDIHVAKVAGKISFLPGKTYEFEGKLIHDMQALRNAKLDVSHSIKTLSFGALYPGQQNPLNGASFDQRARTRENPQTITGMTLADDFPDCL